MYLFDKIVLILLFIGVAFLLAFTLKIVAAIAVAVIVVLFIRELLNEIYR